MDERREDWNKLARGRPSTQNIQDSETRRALEANNQNIDYLLRKIQKVVDLKPVEDLLGIQLKPTREEKRPKRPPPKRPTLTLTLAEWVSPFSANFQGVINPTGFATNYYFRYGLTLEFGTNTVTRSLPSGMSSVEVGETVGGIQVPKTYYAQLVAINSEGTSWSNILPFDTGKKPDVTI